MSMSMSNAIQYNRDCDLCGNGQLQDERHVMIECVALDVIREPYSDIYNRAGEDMKKLMNSDAYQVAQMVTEYMDVITKWRECVNFR